MVFEKIEIISIGSELLAGYTGNSNAEFICQELLKEGYEVNLVTTIPDHFTTVVDTLKNALNTSVLTIVTGGLGLTQDDLTREALATALECDIVYDQHLSEELTGIWGYPIEKYGYLPKKCRPLINAIGKAPGLTFSDGKSALIALPGVPVEMRMMFSQALPLIRKRLARVQQQHTYSYHICQLAEQQLQKWLDDHELARGVSAGIYPNYGYCSLILRSPSMETLDTLHQDLIRDFRFLLFSQNDSRIEKAVHEKFREKNYSLALAESCTGGALASRLTALPDASEYFLGSFVAYSDALKSSVLDVPASLIQEKGAVSTEVAQAMAYGALNKAKSDYAIAVSGIVGPKGGTAFKPIGRVYAAIAERQTRQVFPFTLPLLSQKTRNCLITYTATYVLSILWQRIAFNLQWK